MVRGLEGVNGWVRVSRHALSMVDTEGVLAKGGVSVFVFKGLGLFLVPVVLLLLRLGTRGFECVIVQIPDGQW